MPIIPKSLVLLCLCSALATGGSGIYIKAKAQLAQVLMIHAWNKALETNKQVKPWPWADIHPVARLTVPSRDLELIILEGISGEAMAFGPGRIPESSNRLDNGVYAIGGHRDTHLAFLEDLEEGTELIVQTKDGQQARYQVANTFVADSDQEELSIHPTERAFTLITCYPFNATQTGGPLRYVVVSTPMEEIQPPTST